MAMGWVMDEVEVRSRSELVIGNAVQRVVSTTISQRMSTAYGVEHPVQALQLLQTLLFRLQCINLVGTAWDQILVWVLDQSAIHPVPVLLQWARVALDQELGSGNNSVDHHQVNTLYPQVLVRQLPGTVPQWAR